jgi:hypothetical protein
MEAMAFSKAPFNEDKKIEQEFLLLRDKFNIDTAVETGTYHGTTTRWLSQHFKRVFTVEINEEYFSTAFHNLNGCGNIKMYPGNSVEVLPHILKKCTDKTILFLDAHWNEYNPLLDELRCIAEAKIRPVIAIHDFKNPYDVTMGYDTYPAQQIIYEWDWIMETIENIYGKGGFEQYYNKEAEGARRGIIYITPKH